MRWLKFYLIACGLVGHLALLALWLKEPALIYEARQKLQRELIARGYLPTPPLADSSQAAVGQQLAQVFLPWQPVPSDAIPQGIWLNGQVVPDLASAQAQLKNGDLLQIGPGIYQQSLLISADDVTIEGMGHVIFEKAAADNKGLFVLRGQRTTLKNIECRGIQVSDGNGACVRFEGKDLTLEHVYFHSSQTGLLETSANAGSIVIKNSRFAQLGFAGQAHGIYLNSADLLFQHSLMLAAKDAGHGIKSRGASTQISSSILATLGSDDSRLVDIANGGFLQITDSILQEGPNSQNFQLIGFGLEQLKHPSSQLVLQRNLVIIDRDSAAQLVKTVNNSVQTEINSNVFVGPLLQDAPDNISFADRSDAGIAPAPALPLTKPICGSAQTPLPACPLQAVPSE